MDLNQPYEIYMYDPMSKEETRLVLPRREVSRMRSRVISQAVIASCQIEGEDMEGVFPIEVENLPRSMLITPD